MFHQSDMTLPQLCPCHATASYAVLRIPRLRRRRLRGRNFCISLSVGDENSDRGIMSFNALKTLKFNNA